MAVPRIDWDQLNRIVGPNSAGANIAGLVGAFLKSKGENDRADRVQGATNEQTRARLLQDHTQFGATMAHQTAQSRRDEQLRRAAAIMNSTRLGENEDFATRNRILRSTLPNMRGGSFSPGDASVAAAMGSRQSPFANGIDPATLSALSEEATAGAIADRGRMALNIDPNSPIADFGRMGFDSEMGDFGLADYQTGRQTALADADQALEDRIQQALAMDYEGIMKLPGDPQEQKQQGRGGFLGGLGRVLKFAAPIAAAFIPGIGPIASAALAGGGSAAGSLLAGDPMQDALLGGALSGAGAYGARKLPTGPQPGQGRGYGVLRGR